MYYIGFFFNGFVLSMCSTLLILQYAPPPLPLNSRAFLAARLPFPLTLRFKSMLQRGIETQDMDVSWVSSVSWYFLCLFGLSSVYRLLLGEDNGAPPSSVRLTVDRCADSRHWWNGSR